MRGNWREVQGEDLELDGWKMMRRIYGRGRLKDGKRRHMIGKNGCP